MKQNILASLLLVFSLLFFSKCASMNQIECQYDIQTTEEYTSILSDKFIPDSPIEMSINGEEVDFTNRYLFPKTGYFQIIYKITGPTNMDFMFEGVSTLMRVEMISTENMKIKRFESTFENCVNLLTFTMKGFDTSSATTMKRMFYGTSKLDRADLGQFNTENVLDMSSMFESSNIYSLEPRNFNTKI